MNYISSAVHDIATPLATSQLCVDVLIDDPGVDVGTPQYDLLQKLSLSTELAQATYVCGNEYMRASMHRCPCCTVEC